MSKIIRRTVSEVAIAVAARASQREVENFRQEKENMKDGLIADNSVPGRKAQVWQQYNVWGIDKSLIVQRDTRNRM